MRQILVLLAVVLTCSPHLINGNKCPPPEGIMPCRCRDRNDQIQVWCSHSDLERVNGALENLMRLRNLPAIDELIVENNRMPSLPARAFGALQIGRLLLRHNGLESISRNAFAGLEDSIEELYIVEDKLVDFPFDAIEQLKNLEAFTVERSKIRLLPRFNGLNRLKHIRIDGSLITGLPVGAFAQMASVKQIHVVNSNLASLAAGIFGPLETLILANFSGNRIDIVQRRSFALLPKLEVLSLVNNRLEDAAAVGRACEELTSLKSLDLSMNKFKSLPEGSFVNLRTLQMLNLNFNKIGSVSPRSFTHLPALRKVDLSGNELRNFPQTLFESTPLLEELRMQKNLLSTPSEIGQVLASLKSLRFLDLGGNGITVLPSGALVDHTQLQRIDFSDNRIERIEPGAFKKMLSLTEMSFRNNSLTALPSDAEAWSIPSLKELDVSYNKLKSLSVSTLGGLPGLRRVDLSFNSLKTIGPGQIFGNNKILEDLHLEDNVITQISDDALRGLGKLMTLDLSRNHLENIPNGMLQGLRKLRVLNMANNRIKNLPANLFTDLKGLEELSLKSNGLTVFPRNVFSPLENLRELNLKLNSISELASRMFGGLKNLEILKLASNKINLFDDDAFNDLVKLRTIDLNSNRIAKIPPKSFQNLPSLEKFEARENRIMAIENGAFAASNRIEILDLAHNALTEISPMIISKVSLKVLDLSHNMIEKVHRDTFRDAANLMELYLNHNRIQNLSSSTFSNLDILTIVDLDGNEIRQILPFTFRNLPKLIYLRISRNKIRTITKQAFSNLNSLDGLDLQENELESISEAGFEKTGSLKYLNLSHNNFDSVARMGLFPLPTLEVLDVSYNRIREVDDKSLRHLQWLVELRLNDNGICRIPVGVFDGMSRLKMLVLRNNFLSRLYESAFYKLKNNIAYLDISGNPIVCDCELIWLRNLMSREAIQELSDSSCESPNELRGLAIKNIRPGRMVCSSESNRLRGVPPSKYNEADCPTLTISKRKPRPVITYDIPADKPLFGSGAGPSSDINPDYDATTTTDLKHRRKDEKLVDSSDYSGVVSDTPTIYAISGGNNKKSSSGSGTSSSNTALNSLSTLFGFPLPSLDFGLNLGISPSVSVSEKDGEDPDHNTRVLKNPDPLPPSWLDRPSKAEHVKNPNVYEPPEYIPRKPIQPYIPLNPYAETNTRANVISPNGNTRSSSQDSLLAPINYSQGSSNPSRPIRFPSTSTQQQEHQGSRSPGAASASIQSWHPSYPSTETGFIPIEPFFHNSKNTKTSTTTNRVRENNATASITFHSSDRVSSSNTRLPIVKNTLTPHEKSTEGALRIPTDSTTPTSAPQTSSQEDGDYPDDVSYTPVYIQNGDSEEISANENLGAADVGVGAGGGLSDFWNMFAKKNNKTEEEIGETLLKASDELTGPFPPFNFSAPIDTEISSNTNDDVNDEFNPETASERIPLPPINEIANTFSSSNQVPLEAEEGNIRRPTSFGKPTITKIRLDETGSSPNFNDPRNPNNNQPFPNMNINSIERKTAGSAPPVVIGEQEEPLDWYYTSYNNPPNPGEELEKYLERNRATRLDDVLVGIGPQSPSSTAGGQSLGMNWWTCLISASIVGVFNLYHIL